MYLHQPKKEGGRKKSIAIGIFLAILIVGLFWFKNSFYQNSQEKQTTEITPTNTSPDSISPEELSSSVNDDIFQIIDIRSAEEFELEHIESSINIPIKNNEADLDSNLFNKEKTLVLVEESSSGIAKSIAEKLSAQGYRAKYLQGGIKAYQSAGYNLIAYGNVESSKDKAKVNFISGQELSDRSTMGEIFVFLDVRKKEDYVKNHIENSINIPLEMLEKNKREIPLGKIVVVDENPVRSFQGAVRLFDMNIIGVYCLEGSLSDLRKIVENKNATSEKAAE